MIADRLAGFKEAALRVSAGQVHTKPLDCDQDHLTVLHLSDIHFNNEGCFRFKKAPGTSDAPSLADKVAQALSSAPTLQPDAVIISGDFAFKNTHYELAEYVKKELDALRDLLGVPFSRWVVVPGNHDIDWGAEKYAKASGDRSQIYPVKTKDYFSFVYRRIQSEKGSVLADRLKKWEVDSDDEWKADPIRHYMPSFAAFKLKSGQRIEIHGYNSCLVEGADWPGIGFVGNGQPALFEYVSAMEAAGSAIKIAVLHHHVKEVSRVVTLPEGDVVAARMEFSLIADSRALLDKLLANGYSMVLHGHQHQPFISQEVRPSYGTDPAEDSWYRDYVDQRILIFGAGSVSFVAKEPSNRTDNAFFVHRISSDQTVATWNFTMGAGYDKFQRRNPCPQPLRGFFSSTSIKNRLANALDRIEKSDPAGGSVTLPNPCESVDRVLGTGLYELLTALGALRRDGQKYRLNLPDKARDEDKNLGRSNNLPGRFAKLLRLALEHNVPLFSEDWMPVRSFGEWNVFNLMRWVSLSFAEGILESKGLSLARYFQSGSFARAVLSEYDHTLPLPQEAVEQRTFLACAVPRKAPNGPELLLQRHPEWEAMLVPAAQRDDSNLKKAVGENLIKPWFDGRSLFKVWPTNEVVQKLQISPSKGVWTHYTFKICFLAFEAGARTKLDKFAGSHSHGLEFISIKDIRDSWSRSSEEIDDNFDDPLTRSAVVNRKLIEHILRLVDTPDFKYFYDFYDPT